MTTEPTDTESDHGFKYSPDDQLPQDRPPAHRRAGRRVVSSTRTLALWWGVGALAFFLAVTAVHSYNYYAIAGPVTVVYAVSVVLVVLVTPAVGGAIIDVACRRVAARLWGDA